VELEHSSEQYYFDLLEYLAHFTFAPALETFSVGTRKFPSSARQHEGKGLVHYALRQYPEAADSFLTALEITPSSPAASAAWNALHTLLSPVELENLLPRLQRLSELHLQIAEAQFWYALALLTQALASSNHPERLDAALHSSGHETLSFKARNRDARIVLRLERARFREGLSW
jgi:tetratricopeptide (TPR) repeat protein